MDNCEYIPYLHNGKIIMVPVLELDEVSLLKQLRRSNVVAKSAAGACVGGETR